MLMPGRNYQAGYRFGFNGQEMDDEVYGTKNLYAFKFRMSDPRLGGQFWSIDPLAPQYPGWSPYHFAQRTPIWARELEGLEAWYTTTESGDQELIPNAAGPLSNSYADEIGATHYGVLENQFFDNGVGDRVVENVSNMTNSQLNCGGDCFAVAKSRINQAFKDVTGTGLPTTTEFNRQWNVVGRNAKAAEGSAGALSDAGLGDFKTREQIMAGELRPGAAIQVWTHNTVQESVDNGYGHSFVFLNYTYDDAGNITGMNIADQGFLNNTDVGFSGYPAISGANLGETRQVEVLFPR